MSKYFKYINGVFSTKSGKRPGNQSNKELLLKIGGKYAELNNNSNVVQTPVGKKYMSVLSSTPVNKKMPLAPSKIDIAHGISIANIMKLLAAAMNAKKKYNEFKDLVEAFGYAMFSNDEPSIKKLGDFFEAINTLKPTALMKEADKIATMLNAAVNNLFGGHAPTNRSISSKNDPHVVLVKIEADGPLIPTTLPDYTYVLRAFENLSHYFDVPLSCAAKSSESRSSSLSRHSEKSHYDPSLFSNTMTGIINRQSDALDNAKEEKKKDNTHPYENPNFELACNDFVILNQPGLRNFTAQDDCLDQRLLDENIALSAFQYKTELFEQYGLEPKDLPADFRRGMFGGEYDDLSDSEESDDINNSEDDENNINEDIQSSSSYGTLFHMKNQMKKPHASKGKVIIVPSITLKFD